MMLVLVDDDGEPSVEEIRTDIHQFLANHSQRWLAQEETAASMHAREASDTYLNELFNVVWIPISLHLVHDENKSVDSSHVVTPKVRVLSIEVPDLKRASLRHWEFEIIEGFSEEDFLDGLQEAAVGRLARPLHPYDHQLVSAALASSHFKNLIILLQ